ncbi:MAG: hypothetical protein FWF70_01875, partial [Bacteroidetes bacterium]|nr:hypothetical protein [Bacteroidota bacterium]
MKKIYIHLLIIFFTGIYSLSAQNTDGTDFWVTFGNNNNVGANSVNLKIRIVNRDQPSTVTIKFFGNTSIPDIVRNMSPKEVFTYTLNQNEKNASYITYSGGGGSKSVYIHSTNPITAYALNQYSSSTDATNLLPEPALGTDYYQISYKPGFATGSYYDDAYAVIAIKPNTKIYENNVPIPVTTLNRGEVYYKAMNNMDMTGYHIQTDSAVAFFSLNSRVQIPADPNYNRDNLFQQLAPVNTWGTIFFVPTSQYGNDRVRIVAAEAGTNISVIGGTLQTVPYGQPSLNNLMPGQFVEIKSSASGCYIETNKRVGVCAYLTSYFDHNMPCYCSASAGIQCSDPGMAWVPSIDQTAKNAMIAPFAVPSNQSNLCSHYALIVTPTGTKAQTKVYRQGSLVPLTGSWIDNAASGMSFLSYTMDNNESISYNFTNPNELLVLGYGIGHAESYYYLGYSSMRNLDAGFKAFGIYHPDGVHYQNMPDELFCEQEIEFGAFFADPESISTDPNHLQWYIGSTEITAARDDMTWTHTLTPGQYLIKMRVLYADGSWSDPPFESTLNIGAHITASITPPGSGSVFPIDTCVSVGSSLTLTATPATNYVFDKWTENGTEVGGTSNAYTFTVSANRSIVANFRLNTLTINLSASPPAGGTPNGGGPHNCDEWITVHANPNQCYNFVNWTEGGVEVSTEADYYFQVLAARNLVANFTVIPYTITTTASPGGTATGGGIRNCGTNITVIATPAIGYHFVEWQEGGLTIPGANASYTFTVAGDRELMAIFELNVYNVVVSATTGGNASGGGTNIYHGTSVTVTATPINNCYTFLNWTEEGTVIPGAGATYNFIVERHRNLVANFEQITYPVTLFKYPENGGRVYCN